MEQLISNPLFSILLCILAYKGATLIQQKTKLAIANPLLIAIVLIIGFLLLFDIDFDQFMIGGNFIGMLVGPATAALALSIYRQVKQLKEYFIPIIVGTLVGSITSVGSVILLCKLMNVDTAMMASLIPKSVTTAIAMDISASMNGIVPITIISVLITGIVGAVFAPMLIKVFKINNPVVRGIAIGASSHALGTSKAVEIGEVEGAMSGIALALSGIFTVIIALLLSSFI